MLMTKVLYEKQRKENKPLELDPTHFQTMLENAEPLLKGFFNELYNSFTPDRRSAYNKNENKKKVINICYSIAAIRNKFVNHYPLEIRLYLAASGTSCDAINTMHNDSIFVYNLDDYHNIHGIRHPDTVFLSTAAHFVTCISKEISNCALIPINSCWKIPLSKRKYHVT